MTESETGPLEIYEAVSTAVWTDGTTGKAINAQPEKTCDHPIKGP